MKDITTLLLNQLLSSYFSEKQLREWTATYSVDERGSVLDGLFSFVSGIFAKKEETKESSGANSNVAQVFRFLFISRLWWAWNLGNFSVFLFVFLVVNSSMLMESWWIVWLMLHCSHNFRVVFPDNYLITLWSYTSRFLWSLLQYLYFVISCYRLCHIVEGTDICSQLATSI